MMPAAVKLSGVHIVVENISRLPPDLFGETCRHVLMYLQGQTRGVDSAEISDKLQSAGFRLEADALQDIIRFLLLTFRYPLSCHHIPPFEKHCIRAYNSARWRKSGGKHNVSGDEIVSKLEEGSGKWTKASLQVVHRLWSEHGASVHTQQKVQTALSIGQLVDIQWKLGMAVSSDTCRNLNSPYVTLQMKIAEPSGHIRQRSFEMSVQQFQNFHQQFKEMAAVMETV